MPTLITKRRLSTLLGVAVCILATQSNAESSWPRPGRLTGDRDADLIAALVDRGRFDDASQICDPRLRNAKPTDDAAASWRIRQSEVALARQLAAGDVDENVIDDLTGPLNEFLSSYPAHRRSLFVRAQITAIERALARYDVLAVAVSPTDESAIDRAFKRLARATAKTTELSAAVSLARAKLDNQREDVRDFALITDLTRLEQQLLVDTVSMALLQTELFPSGSRDRITAAVRAEQAAADAAVKLPADSQARFATERLKVQAILGSGQIRRAEAELARLYEQLDPPVPANLEALRVRVDLAQNRGEAAGKRLDAFYGSSPADAPRSVEMDLTRLEFLLSQPNQLPNRVGPWLEMIQQRSGPYARRRAEAIALAKLRSSGSSQAVDPSLVAAQGQDWLRRGKPLRGGELLAAAALAETDGDRAIRLASEAAAAFTSAASPAAAAKILSQVATSKPQAADAAAAQLQSAILYADSDLPDAAKLVESSLRSVIRGWPKSDAAKAARKWLLKLLPSQNRDLEAAEVATMIPVDSLRQPDLSTALRLWQRAIQQADDDSSADVIARFQTAFRPLLENALAAAEYRSAAAYLLDRSSLSSLPARQQDTISQADRFADSLIQFRRDGTMSPALASPPETRVSDATGRLMIDGRGEPSLRDAIAKLVTTWPVTPQPSLADAERLIWMGKTTEAIQMAESLVKASDRPGDTLERAARLFGSSDHDAALAEAIRLWDEIAAGIPQGGERWHEAKLESIELLIRAARQDEARRRAKYVLLTAAPGDQDLTLRYESAAAE